MVITLEYLFYVLLGGQSKADALSIINNHESLMKLWEWSLKRVHDTDMKARIRGVQSHMLRFDFFFRLTLGECLLRNADNLSADLQSKDLTAAEGKSMSMKTVKAISLMRSDEAYTLFWQKVIQNAERIGVEEPCLRGKKECLLALKLEMQSPNITIQHKHIFARSTLRQ